MTSREKFWKMPGKYYNFAAKFFSKALLKIPLQNLRSKFNSTLILKISRKNIESLLSSIILNTVNCLYISKTEIWAILVIFAIIWPKNPQLSSYWADIHRECVV